jgi:cell filamentation protein
MSKDRSPFCFPENIDAEMKALFHRLRDAAFFRNLSAEDFAGQAAGFLAYLNAVHPFREGNGRTQLTFMALVAARAGHPFDVSRLDPAGFLQAMVVSFFGDEEPLRQHLLSLVDN